MKKFLSILTLLIIMVAMISSCDGNGNNSNNSGEDSSPVINNATNITPNKFANMSSFVSSQTNSSTVQSTSKQNISSTGLDSCVGNLQLSLTNTNSSNIWWETYTVHVKNTGATTCSIDGLQVAIPAYYLDNGVSKLADSTFSFTGSYWGQSTYLNGTLSYDMTQLVSAKISSSGQGCTWNGATGWTDGQNCVLAPNGETDLFSGGATISQNGTNYQFDFAKAGQNVQFLGVTPPTPTFESGIITVNVINNAISKNTATINILNNDSKTIIANYPISLESSNNQFTVSSLPQGNYTFSINVESNAQINYALTPQIVTITSDNPTQTEQIKINQFTPATSYTQLTITAPSALNITNLPNNVSVTVIGNGQKQLLSIPWGKSQTLQLVESSTPYNIVVQGACDVVVGSCYMPVTTQVVANQAVQTSALSYGAPVTLSNNNIQFNVIESGSNQLNVAFLDSTSGVFLFGGNLTLSSGVNNFKFPTTIGGGSTYSGLISYNVSGNNVVITNGQGTFTSTNSAQTINVTATTPVVSSVIFSPYKDVTINMNWNTNVISTKVTSPTATAPLVQVRNNSLKNLNNISLAFASGNCGSETWAGVSPDALATANLQNFASNGIYYTISTGGQAGAFTCNDNANHDGIRKFMQRYYTTSMVGLDLDIENSMDATSLANLMNAMKWVQDNYPAVNISLTLATLAGQTGGAAIPDDGRTGGMNAVRAIQAAGVTKYSINLMTMDYGSPASASVCVVQGGLCQMGLSAIQAAQNAITQVKTVDPTFSLSRMELTPMIGDNDVRDEIFSLADASTLLTFAQQNKLRALHIWSFDRDTKCSPTTSSASATCNNSNVGDFDFSNIFISGGSPTPPPPPVVYQGNLAIKVDTTGVTCNYWTPLTVTLFDATSIKIAESTVNNCGSSNMLNFNNLTAGVYNIITGSESGYQVYASPASVNVIANQTVTSAITFTQQTGGGKVLTEFWCGFSGNYCGQSTGDDINPKATHVIMAFANSNADGSISTDTMPTVLISSWRASGKKVLISVGGQNGNWDVIFANATNQQKFIASVVNTIQNANIDGVDLDIEGYATDPNVVATTINNLRSALDAKFGTNPRKLIIVSPENVAIYQGTPTILGVAGQAYNYFIPIIKNAINAIDYVQPQFYNNWYDGYAGGSSQYLLDVYLNWNNQQGLSPASWGITPFAPSVFAGVPQNKLVIGLLASTSAGIASYYTTPATLSSVMNTLASQGNNIAGVMLWDSHWDTLNNNAISNTAASQLGL